MFAFVDYTPSSGGGNCQDLREAGSSIDPIWRRYVYRGQQFRTRMNAFELTVARYISYGSKKICKNSSPVSWAHKHRLLFGQNTVLSVASCDQVMTSQANRLAATSVFKSTHDVKKRTCPLHDDIYKIIDLTGLGRTARRQCGQWWPTQPASSPAILCLRKRATQGLVLSHVVTENCNIVIIITTEIRSQNTPIIPPPAALLKKTHHLAWRSSRLNGGFQPSAPRATPFLFPARAAEPPPPLEKLEDLCVSSSIGERNTGCVLFRLHWE